MTIEKNKVVKVHYLLKLDGEDGPKVEETAGKDPLAFIFGIGMMIPGFEKNLEGKSKGDSFSFLLNPEEAYGPSQEEYVIQIPIQNFADQDGNVNRDQLQVNNPIVMSGDDGRQYRGTIAATSLEHITVDFNHPMAGKNLHFSGEIVEVREASESELEHGHVH